MTLRNARCNDRETLNVVVGETDCEVQKWNEMAWSKVYCMGSVLLVLHITRGWFGIFTFFSPCIIIKLLPLEPTEAYSLTKITVMSPHTSCYIFGPYWHIIREHTVVQNVTA